jgi:hypothetical protein
MSTTTTITVYAVAWGGKFIGTGQDGIAYLTVTNAFGQVVAGVKRVPITQGNVDGGDGSGVTDDIMKSTMWGTAVDGTQAYNYTFSYQPSAPEVLTFTVEVDHYDIPMAFASSQRMVWPGLTLKGATSVQVIIPGLLANVVVPTKPFSIGVKNEIEANVYMMCGCKIDDQVWPAGNYDVQMRISYVGGGNVEYVPLTWDGTSIFRGNWTPNENGKVLLQCFAVEITNGNTAYSPVEGGIVG